MGINIVQKKREKERLERELDKKKDQKKQLGRKLEYAQELLQKNQRAQTNIEQFQIEKRRVLQKFEYIHGRQRSVRSMQAMLGTVINGRSLRELYDGVENKKSQLKHSISSIEGDIEQAKREIFEIERKIEKMHRRKRQP